MDIQHPTDISTLVIRLEDVFSDVTLQYRLLLACQESNAQKLLDTFQWVRVAIKPSSMSHINNARLASRYTSPQF